MCTTTQTCCVPGCNQPACYEALFEDAYLIGGGRVELYRDRHAHCPYLCEEHTIENEEGRQGPVEPRGFCRYPYTHSRGQGAVGYRRLDDGTIVSPMLNCLQTRGYERNDIRIERPQREDAPVRRSWSPTVK